MIVLFLNNVKYNLEYCFEKLNYLLSIKAVTDNKLYISNLVQY